MTNIAYFLSEGSVVNTITVFDASRKDALLTADSAHPHWQAIIDGVAAGDESVFDLFDVAGGVMKRFKQITDRVSYDGVNVLFDGDVVHAAIADQIRRTLEAGEADYRPLVAFWEKLESNPNTHSKEQAYNWLSTHDFKITEDGDVVAYKGVKRADTGGFVSISSGDAIVDGVAHSGYIPNGIGSVVTMPRSKVAHDPSRACHYGLHAGDWSYANNFAQGAVLEVHINPRDIVSVPSDSSYRKVRTCRYEVIQVITAEHSGGPVLRPSAIASSWAGDVGYKPSGL